MSTERTKDETINFWQLVENYKIPLILVLIGVVIFGFGLIFPLIFKQSTPSLTIPSDQTSSQIKVDIAGEVMNPGVYELPSGARVENALDLAGGLTKEADNDWVAKNLNLAKNLSDGEKIYVPSKSALRDLGQVLGQPTTKISLNSASTLELDTLPGIGEVTAKKIVSNRPYQSVEELRTKKVVSEGVFEKIKDLVRVF
ncbi:MAG: ComEA family DNA-binding protein [Patescibacteria group bacterium]|nr:ComEA family DNA-binding protein [Patescibacteria group bacterium]